MYIFKAGVVGAGAMGGEIAQVIAWSGLPVVLKDVDADALERGMQHARAIFERRVKAGKLSDAEMRAKMELIIPTLNYADFSDVDFAIEAVPEKIHIKQAVFAELDAALNPEAILASNTSALSITEIAGATKRPQKIVGFHFFNPASVMKLVEVVAGEQTSAETLDDAVSFAEELRKLPVRVKECAGFIVNRVLMASMVEIVKAQVESGVSREEIDALMKERAGVPMGPFLLADMLGLDIAHDVAQTLERAYGPRFASPAPLERLVAAGKLGVKSGEGFYTHTTSGDRAS